MPAWPARSPKNSGGLSKTLELLRLSDMEARKDTIASRRGAALAQTLRRVLRLSAPRPLGWLRRLAACAKTLGPYAAIELLLPGGTLVVLALWLYRRHRSARATIPKGSAHYAWSGASTGASAAMP